MKQNDYLKLIYHNINLGGVYGKEYSYGIDYNLYLTNDNYIGWRHYGSSANKNNLKELEWIIRTIFKTTPKKFVEEYQLYNI